MLIQRGGREVSRIEGFSDAVFGFALTLLVASIEVPPDFEALKQTLRGFFPFALTFALISLDLVPALLILSAVRPRGSV